MILTVLFIINIDSKISMFSWLILYTYTNNDMLCVFLQVSASSVPCLAKKDVENNCSTRPKHEIKTKHPEMASEPLLPLVNSNAEKSEETIIECCQSTGGKDITTACKDTHLLSQRKGGSLSSLEYYFFCSQSGPVVKEKGHDGRKAAGESRSQSLQVLNSCASSSASTSQLPVNLCDNLTETTSIVTPKAKYQGSKSLEEQSIASDLSKGTELRESCGLMCRICHSGFEEGELIRPCKCTGTVKHAHQSCILNWVSKSGNQNCELCKFKFRTRKESVKCFWKVSCHDHTFNLNLSINLSVFILYNYENTAVHYLLPTVSTASTFTHIKLIQ